MVGIEMVTDFQSTFNGSVFNLVGYDMTKIATERLFRKTKFKIDDVDVVELHDGATTNEVIIYEALGLCKAGGASDFIDRKDFILFQDKTYQRKFLELYPKLFTGDNQTLKEKV
jgi:sterol carrier protein 2